MMKTYEHYYKVIAALVDNLHYNLDDADYYRYNELASKQFISESEAILNIIMLRKQINLLQEKLEESLKEGAK